MLALFRMTAAVVTSIRADREQFAARLRFRQRTRGHLSRLCVNFAPLGFGTDDHAKIRKIMGKVTTPEAERAAIAKAVAWYGKRIAPEAGTARARARATANSSGDPSQIDCVESSLNTTSILLMLQQLGLLHYHHVEPYVSRMTFDWVHSTAVLADLKTGQKWAFDTWVRNSGELPDVRPLADWYRGD